MQRLQRAMIFQAFEFDKIKKTLLQDLQNRCEKVVILEMQLDEINRKYQHKHNDNSLSTQQQKITIMEKNMKNMLTRQAEVIALFLHLNTYLYSWLEKLPV